MSVKAGHGNILGVAGKWEGGKLAGQLDLGWSVQFAKDVTNSGTLRNPLHFQRDH